VYVLEQRRRGGGGRGGGGPKEAEGAGGEEEEHGEEEEEEEDGSGRKSAKNRANAVEMKLNDPEWVVQKAWELLGHVTQDRDKKR
jgi:hypothetical protein